MQVRPFASSLWKISKCLKKKKAKQCEQSVGREEKLPGFMFIHRKANASKNLIAGACTQYTYYICVEQSQLPTTFYYHNHETSLRARDMYSYAWNVAWLTVSEGREKESENKPGVQIHNAMFADDDDKLATTLPLPCVLWVHDVLWWCLIQFCLSPSPCLICVRELKKKRWTEVYTENRWHIFEGAMRENFKRSSRRGRETHSSNSVRKC